MKRRQAWPWGLSAVVIASIWWRQHAALLALATGLCAAQFCFLVWLAAKEDHPLCGGRGCRICGWSGRRYRSALAGWTRRGK